MAKNVIESAIRNVANNKLAGKYNLAQYKEGGSRFEEKKKAMLHKQICEEIVAFADNHKDILSISSSLSVCQRVHIK